MLAGEGMINGDRYNFLNVTFWRRFKRETGIDIDYRTFVSIIDLSNRRIKKRVVENPEGFKCPENLGYFVITRYKSKGKKRDWGSSRKLGVPIYHTNFHSGGYDARIMWFTDKIAICANIGEYKFIPDRDFQHMKSAKLKEGKRYNEYSYSDFRMKKIRINLDKIIYGK